MVGIPEAVSILNGFQNNSRNISDEMPTTNWGNSFTFSKRLFQLKVTILKEIYSNFPQLSERKLLQKNLNFIYSKRHLYPIFGFEVPTFQEN